MQPLITTYAVPTHRLTWRDEDTANDPLPAIVTTQPDGSINERTTRFTDVKHETTDDQ